MIGKEISLNFEPSITAYLIPAINRISDLLFPDFTMIVTIMMLRNLNENAANQPGKWINASIFLKMFFRLSYVYFLNVNLSFLINIIYIRKTVLSFHISFRAYD